MSGCHSTALRGILPRLLSRIESLLPAARDGASPRMHKCNNSRGRVNYRTHLHGTLARISAEHIERKLQPRQSAIGGKSARARNYAPDDRGPRCVLPPPVITILDGVHQKFKGFTLRRGVITPRARARAASVGAHARPRERIKSCSAAASSAVVARVSFARDLRVVYVAVGQNPRDPSRALVIPLMKLALYRNDNVAGAACYKLRRDYARHVLRLRRSASVRDMKSFQTPQDVLR